jgi:localization factor PodJL
MNKAVPWNVKGVGADVREAAKQAARRAGMSLGEWLNSVIADQAAELGIEPHDMDSDARLAALTHRLQSKPAEEPAGDPQPAAVAKGRGQGSATSLAAMAAQLTEMGQRMGRKGRDPERDGLATAHPQSGETGERSDLTAKLNALLELLTAQRNRSLAEAAAAKTDAMAGPDLGPDLIDDEFGGTGAAAANHRSAIGQLIDARFAEALAQMEQALKSVRSEWDAKAIGALRSEFERLAERLETSARREAVPGLDRIAQEVTAIASTVAGLAPRDRLIALEATLSRLAQRVDDLPERALLPVEAMAADLRTMIQNADPRDMIATLDGDLSAIARKIEAAYVAHPDDQKFDDLAGQLQALHRQVELLVARPAPPIELLERQIGALADGLERLSQDVPTRQSAAALAQTIDDLRERIGASGAAPLATKLDQGLAALAAQIDSLGGALPGQTAIDDAQTALMAGLERLRETAKDDFGTLAALVRGLETNLDSVRSAQNEPMARLEGRFGAIDTTLAALGDPAARQAETAAFLREIRELVSEHPAARSLAAVDARIAQLMELLERQSTLQLTRAEDGRLALRRLEAIQERLAQPSEATSVALRPIEEQLRTLNEKLDANQPSELSFATLEAQVSRIVDRIERSDEGLISLTSLQRSILDLFSRLDETRQTTLDAIDTVAKSAAREARESLPTHPAAAALDGGEAIARQLTDIRQSQDNADRRVYATLTAVHATLEKVVARLSSLDHRQETRPAEPVAAAELPAAVAPAAAPPMPPAAAPLPAKQGFDVLIEPGSGLAPARKTGASTDEPEASQPTPGQAGFIAAARRAAQAAAAEAALATAQRRGVPLATETPSGAGSAPATRPRGRRLWLAGLACAVLCAAALAFYLVMPASDTIGDAVVTSPSPESGGQAKERPPAPPGEAAPGGETTRPPQPRTENAPMPENPIQSLLLAPAGQNPAAGFLPQVAANPAHQTGQTNPLALGTGPASPGPEPALSAAAAAGHAAAQYELGIAYFEGRTVGRDLKAAALWLEKAATQGLAPAQYRLATLFEKGMGVARDPSLAKLWYQRSSERGNARAMHNLAVMTAEGATGKPDYATAAIWFKKAAELGVADSQYNLAILYARGLGVDQNLSQSYLWFSAAAAQGDDDAAKKRDEVAAKLDGAALEAAKALAGQFQPKAVDPAANEVSAPPGGWDALGQKADSKGPARLPARPKVTRL